MVVPVADAVTAVAVVVVAAVVVAVVAPVVLTEHSDASAQNFEVGEVACDSVHLSAC